MQKVWKSKAGAYPEGHMGWAFCVLEADRLFGGEDVGRASKKICFVHGNDLATFDTC